MKPNKQPPKQYCTVIHSILHCHSFNRYTAGIFTLATASYEGRSRWRTPAIGNVPGRVVVGVWIGILLLELMVIAGKQNMPFLFNELREEGTRPHQLGASTLGIVFPAAASSKVATFLRTRAPSTLGTDELLYQMTGGVNGDEDHVAVLDASNQFTQYITIPCTCDTKVIAMVVEAL